MAEQPQTKKSKSLIPPKAQIPLLLVGLPILAYVGWSFATQMGWIGGPPKAKPPQTTKEVKPVASSPVAAKPATPSSPLSASKRGPTAAPTDLDAIRAPSGDPMRDLNAPPPPSPTTRRGAGPAPSPKPPTGTAEPPPLPPPMPTPTPGPSGFPSPVTGGTTAPPPPIPPVPTAAIPSKSSLPPALTISYPMARRGSRAASAPAPVSLVGTISGNKGALAVVHSTESATARGQYVRPGQQLPGGSHRVDEIGLGNMKISGRGGTHELSVARPQAPTPSPQSEPPIAASHETPAVKPTSE